MFYYDCIKGESIDTELAKSFFVAYLPTSSGVYWLKTDGDIIFIEGMSPLKDTQETYDFPADVKFERFCDMGFKLYLISSNLVDNHWNVWSEGTRLNEPQFGSYYNFAAMRALNHN
jgi:hypothetical protein